MRKLLLALLLLPVLGMAQQADTLQRLTPYQIENLREAGSELRAGSAKTVLGTAIGLLSIGAGAYIAAKPATYSGGQIKDNRKTGLIVMGVGTAIGLTISIGGANNIASAGGWLRNLWRTSKPKEQIDWENSQRRKGGKR